MQQGVVERLQNSIYNMLSLTVNQALISTNTVVLSEVLQFATLGYSAGPPVLQNSASPIVQIFQV